VVIEAMSFGAVSIVVYYFPRIEEIISGGRNGYVIHRGDAAGIIDILVDALTCSGNLERLQHNTCLTSKQYCIQNVV